MPGAIQGEATERTEERLVGRPRDLRLRAAKELLELCELHVEARRQRPAVDVDDAVVDGRGRLSKVEVALVLALCEKLDPVVAAGGGLSAHEEGGQYGKALNGTTARAKVTRRRGRGRRLTPPRPGRGVSPWSGL